MQPTMSEGWEAVHRAYASVKDFAPTDQVTATAWAVVAVLRALRETSQDAYVTRTAFNRTCDEALAYLRHQIAALQFPLVR